MQGFRFFLKSYSRAVNPCKVLGFFGRAIGAHMLMQGFSAPKSRFFSVACYGSPHIISVDLPCAKYITMQLGFGCTVLCNSWNEEMVEKNYTT